MDIASVVVCISSTFIPHRLCCEACSTSCDLAESPHHVSLPELLACVVVRVHQRGHGAGPDICPFLKSSKRTGSIFTPHLHRTMS
jgi:Fe-S-cluster containining protein